MPVIKNLGWTFDTASTTYDKMRPGYPVELYKALFSYLPIGTDSRVVEVGPGAGQATLPVLQTGCTLTAVEYGKNFSDLCREKFRDFPGFSVITGTPVCASIALRASPATLPPARATST